MTEVEPVARNSPFRRLFLTDSTNNTAPSNVTPDRLVGAATTPMSGASGGDGGTALADSGGAIVDVTRGGTECNGGTGTASLILSPYGTGANGNTFTVYVFGLARTRLVDNVTAAAGVDGWHRVLLLKFDATLNSSLPGVATGPVDNTRLYADVLSDPTASAGVLGTTCRKSSLAGFPGHYEVRVAGWEKVEIVTTKGTATAANMLVKPGTWAA